MGLAQSTDAFVAGQRSRGLTGSAATTTTTPFGTYRPPLAQAFQERATGERFTGVVNHWSTFVRDGARFSANMGHSRR